MLFDAVTLFYTLIILTNYVPRTCRTQPVSGAPVIMATKNLLAMTDARVHSANIDGKMALEKIVEIRDDLRRNATKISGRINQSVDDALKKLFWRVEDLVNGSNVTANDCAAQSFKEINSSAEAISSKVNSCVSNTADSIEKQFNETYISIESVLARINSDHKIAKTCLNEYEKTEMALQHAIVIALCVNQAKERILSAIKDELLPWNNFAFNKVLYNDIFEQLISCDEKEVVSSLTNDTELIYVKIKTCF